MNSASMWRAVGVLFTAGVVIAGVMVTFTLLRPNGESHTDSTQETYAKSVSSLKFVDFESSDIHVVAGADNEVRIARLLRWEGENQPKAQEIWAGDSLTVSHSCGSADSDECSIRYTITVPRAVTVQAETAAGDVSVRGVLGRLDIDVVSGDINVVGSAGNLALTSVSGDIKVSESTSDIAELTAVAGDVSIGYAETPEEVSVETVSGDGSVMVPAGSGGYAVNVVTTSGEQKVTVQRADGTARSIFVETTSGDVTVAYDV